MKKKKKYHCKHGNLISKMKKCGILMIVVVGILTSLLVGCSSSTGNASGGGNISFTGTEKCKFCKGRTYYSCSSAYCLKGTCKSCENGVYDHGSYISECRVCGGDAKCNTCGGSGKIPCRFCKGTGKRSDF